jgi:hypothetical protein
MNRFLVACAFVAGVSLLAPAPASAQVFTDGFESYAPGTLPNVNGWTDFGGTQFNVVSTTQAHSGTQSIRQSEGTTASGNNGYGSDLFRNFLPAGVTTTGKYSFSYWQFIEPGLDTVAFNFHSTGFITISGTGFQTGLDLRTNSNTGGATGPGSTILAVQQVGASNLIFGSTAQIYGSWVQHSLDIDLDNNLYTYKYNGNLVVGGQPWDRDLTDGVSLGGFNFWVQVGNANNITNFVYYDDFSLTAVPEPSSMLLAPLGIAGWKLLRRRKK